MPVVIEIKSNKAKDSALGQLLGYLQAIEEMYGNSPRGIIIAERFSKRLKNAVKRIPEIELVRYHIQFKFDSV